MPATTELLAQEVSEFPLWIPSERHLILCEMVTAIVTEWQPRMTWLAGWQIFVSPVPESDDHVSARIQSAGYRRRATIEVRESLADQPFPGVFAWGTPIELIVVHELCHILFESLRNQAYFWSMHAQGLTKAAELALRDAEEIAVWALADSLHALTQGDQ